MVRNTFVIFLISGFWHGANWTFIVWGAYHAVLFLPLILTGKNRKYTNNVAEGRRTPTLRELGQMLLTFAVVVVGWIIFRSPGLPTLSRYLLGMCHIETLSAAYKIFVLPELWPTMLFIIMMLVVEWIHRNRQHGLDFADKLPVWAHATICLVLCLCVEYYFLRSMGSPSSFIYFQF